MSDTILVTGGTGKFGKIIIKHFAEKGFKVLFTSTDLDKLHALEDEQKAFNVKGYQVDFFEDEAVGRLLDQIDKDFGGVNHLINNARSMSTLRVGEDGQTLRRDFQNEFLMDVIIPYELSISLFRKQKKSLKTITNIGSQYGVVAANKNLYTDYETQSPIQYGVSKAALSHLTKELAVRFAPSGIRVNCIAYGGVEGRVDEIFLKRYRTLCPSERMLKESEITGPIDLLISEYSSAITGHTLVADCGWSLW